MGVYISNETMPEDCYTCFCYETEFNMCSLTGKRLDNIRIRQNDCPLIEIDEKAFNEVIKGYLEGLKAIQNGERRTDDKTEESRP